MANGSGCVQHLQRIVVFHEIRETIKLSRPQQCCFHCGGFQVNTYSNERGTNEQREGKERETKRREVENT